MTIAQALSRLNALKPHEYPEDAVIAWLSDAEQLIANEVTAWHRRPHKEERRCPPPGRYTAATPGDTVLAVPDPYSELYVHYLMAQVDYHNAETARYANSISMFGASLREFSNWYNRTHMPVQYACVRI